MNRTKSISEWSRTTFRLFDFQENVKILNISPSIFDFSKIIQAEIGGDFSKSFQKTYRYVQMFFRMVQMKKSYSWVNWASLTKKYQQQSLQIRKQIKQILVIKRGMVERIPNITIKTANLQKNRRIIVKLGPKRLITKDQKSLKTRYILGTNIPYRSIIQQKQTNTRKDKRKVTNILNSNSILRKVVFLLRGRDLFGRVLSLTSRRQSSSRRRLGLSYRNEKLQTKIGGKQDGVVQLSVDF